MSKITSIFVLIMFFSISTQVVFDGLYNKAYNMEMIEKTKESDTKGSDDFLEKLEDSVKWCDQVIYLKSNKIENQNISNSFIPLSIIYSTGHYLLPEIPPDLA